MPRARPQGRARHRRPPSSSRHGDAPSSSGGRQGGIRRGGVQDPGCPASAAALASPRWTWEHRGAWIWSSASPPGASTASMPTPRRWPTPRPPPGTGWCCWPPGTSSPRSCAGAPTRRWRWSRWGCRRATVGAASPIASPTGCRWAGWPEPWAWPSPAWAGASTRPTSPARPWPRRPGPSPGGSWSPPGSTPTPSAGASRRPGATPGGRWPSACSSPGSRWATTWETPRATGTRTWWWPHAAPLDPARGAGHLGGRLPASGAPGRPRTAAGRPGEARRPRALRGASWWSAGTSRTRASTWTPRWPPSPSSPPRAGR